MRCISQACAAQKINPKHLEPNRLTRSTSLLHQRCAHWHIPAEGYNATATTPRYHRKLHPKRTSGLEFTVCVQPTCQVSSTQAGDSQGSEISNPKNPTHGPLSSSFLWFIFRILQGNPNKELLRGLWVSPKRSSKLPGRDAKATLSSRLRCNRHASLLLTYIL